MESAKRSFILSEVLSDETTYTRLVADLAKITGGGKQEVERFVEDVLFDGRELLVHYQAGLITLREAIDASIDRCAGWFRLEQDTRTNAPHFQLLDEVFHRFYKACGFDLM